MKLLIISSMSNVFRNRILTEFLDEKKIQYKILSPRFKNPFLVPITKITFHIIFKNSIKLLLYFFRYLFDFPNKIYWLLKSDFVYINSMGKYYQLDLKIAWVLKKKIIVDFYSLYYIAIVLDQKLIKNMISNRILMREKELFDLSYIRIFMSNCEKIEFKKIYEFKESAQDIILPYTARNYTKAALNFFKGKNEFLNIFWVGNIKPHHGVAKVVTAISKLIEANYKIRLNVYAGFENDYHYFIKLINSFNLSNSVDFHFNFEFTYENGKLSNEIFKQCDLMLGAFGGESNTRDRSDYATIIKVFDAVANKCPILTKENCATHEIFGESLYYSNSTVEDIIEKIKIIINSDEKTINKKVDLAYSYYVDNASELIFKNKLSYLFKI